MSKLIVRNATPSSITVSGFTVYNIRSENSTFIVEVEGTSNTAPSVGDIITFGNYPQATSTPEPIEWKVLEVDTTNQKALLIAKKVLDGKTYGAYSENTRWSNCSLREWLNSTFKTTAFDSSEQERIILSHIQNPNNSSTATPGGVDTDDYLFCLSIGEANNTSYFSNSEARKGYATQHAIDAGVSVSSGRADWWLRSPGNYNIRAAYVYNSGGVNVSGIEVYENYGVRPALWMDYSQTVRFKAFKYTFNGISYYYVIDGIHNFWTDDLSSIGYSEVSSVVLPTVTDSGDFGGTNNWFLATSDGQITQISANSVFSGYFIVGNISSVVTYDATKSYAIIKWQSNAGVDAGRVEFKCVNDSGNFGAKNVSDSTKTFFQAKVAVCSDSTATVVTVYDSSNNAYNAFKYTIDNIDYYYVLDGTKTDWTNDLSSIGYSEVPSVVLPTVTLANAYVYSASAEPGTMVIYAGNSFMANDAAGNSISYDASLLYKAYASYSGISDPIWFNNGWTPIESSELLAIMNNASSGTRTVHHVCYATCSDSSATVITVYNSSNVAYNAFKFTASGTDYYYVLDGVQTDWTDDLSSIGYRLDMQFYFYFRMSDDDPVDATFDYPSSQNFWGLRIRNQSEKDILDSLGLLAATQFSPSGPYGYLTASTAQTSFSYELKTIFLPDGTQAPFSLSDFYCYTDNNVVECVKCSSSYSTPVRSCLISIKPIL